MWKLGLGSLEYLFVLKSSKKVFVSNRLLGKDRDDLALKATVIFGSFPVEHKDR
jgi:hypothetical protein